MKFALFNLNLRSSNWLGVQIVPFWDLNKLPPTYCLETITDSASGKVWLVTVFSPIRATHASMLFVVGAIRTTQYSLAGSRWIGDGNVTRVATDASEETFISSGPITTCENASTGSAVGVPNSMFLTSTVNFSTGSFFAKNKSTEVRFIPVPSTVNDCANGSLPPLLPLLLPFALLLAAALLAFATCVLDGVVLLLLRFLPPPPPLRTSLGGGGGNVWTIVFTVTFWINPPSVS